MNNPEDREPEFLKDPSIPKPLKLLCAEIVVGGCQDLAFAIQVLVHESGTVKATPEQFHMYHRLALIIAQEFKVSGEKALTEAKRMERESHAATEAALSKAARRTA